MNFFHLLYYICLLSIKLPTNYKATYRLTYHPDSTHMQRVESEQFYLYIEHGKGSSYASENFYKKDSVSVLVKNGVLSDNDIINNPVNRFKTRFPYFVRKDYLNRKIKVYETIGINYSFSVENTLAWKITDQRDTLLGYVCKKATTSYGGRKYEAWFTSEIPISDGPYIFWGLPGLVVKISDTRNHYVLNLKGFGEYKGEIRTSPTYRKKQPIIISQSKAFSLRENLRKNPYEYMNRVLEGALDHATVQRHGSSDVLPARAAMPDRSWDNNPLELK